MKKTIIVLTEAIILTGLYYFYNVKLISLPNSVYIFILSIIYVLIGYIHAKLFIENKAHSVLSIVLVGALSGIMLTIFTLGHAPQGESQIFWFIIGAIINIFVYSSFSIALLLYIPAYIGWRLGKVY